MQTKISQYASMQKAETSFKLQLLPGAFLNFSGFSDILCLQVKVDPNIKQMAHYVLSFYSLTDFQNRCGPSERVSHTAGDGFSSMEDGAACPFMGPEISSIYLLSLHGCDPVQHIPLASQGDDCTPGAPYGEHNDVLPASIHSYTGICILVFILSLHTCFIVYLHCFCILRNVVMSFVYILWLNI